MARFRACLDCKSIFPRTEVNCFGCGKELSTVITEDEVSLSPDELDKLWEIHKKGSQNAQENPPR